MNYWEKLWENFKDYSGSLVGAAIVLVAGVILIKIITKLLRKALTKTKLDAAVYKFIITTVKYILYIVMLVVILSTLRVPTTPLVTMIGACGAAVALALQNSLGNIASGLIILANHPFKSGDTIEVSGVVGVVQSIDIMVTTIKTFDNKVVSIPNGIITNSVLQNYSHEDTRRVDCQFSISYGSDILKAKGVLADVAKSSSIIFNDPAPIIGVASQMDSCVVLDLKVWCPTSKYFEVKYYLEENVKLEFDKGGIAIPFPQLDVHVVNK